MGSSAAVTVPSQGRAQPFLKRLRNGDRIAHLITLIFALSVFLITVLLALELWTKSGPSRAKSGFGFLIGHAWDPVTEKFGALPFIYGTILTSALALLISVPLGVGAAIFLAELAPPRLSDAFTFLIELLAAVPSVVFGLIGIFMLVPVLESSVVPPLKKSLGFLPFFTGPFYGVSVFTASIVLSLMIVPFIISVSREVLLAVPKDLREA